jgi:hypothetical protein
MELWSGIRARGKRWKIDYQKEKRLNFFVGLFLQEPLILQSRDGFNSLREQNKGFCEIK